MLAKGRRWIRRVIPSAFRTLVKTDLVKMQNLSQDRNNIHRTNLLGFIKASQPLFEMLNFIERDL
jgi:hypothetical protein